MGTRVHCDSYFGHTMRDLNEDFNSSNWPTFYRDNGITNGQYYNNGYIDKTTTYANPYCERDALKQKMLEHEAIFKGQLQELHRLYKIQREMMEDVKKKELHRLHVSIEQQPSSSSSNLRGSHLLPSGDAERVFVGGFPLFNSGYGRADIGNSPLSCTKEYNTMPGQSPYLNGSTLKEFEGLDSRPSKARKKLFDLQLPAEKNTDAEEERVDLNEPVRIDLEAAASSVDLQGHMSVNRDAKVVNGDGVHFRNGFLLNSGIENRVNGGLVPHIYEAGSSKSSAFNQDRLNHIHHRHKGMHQNNSLVYSDQSRASQSNNGHFEHREAPRTSSSYTFLASSSFTNSWAHSGSSYTPKRSVFDPSLNFIATIDRSLPPSAQSQLPLAVKSLVNASSSLNHPSLAGESTSMDGLFNGPGPITRESQVCSRNDNSCHNVKRRTIDIDLNEVDEENKTTVDNVSALPWLKHVPPGNDCEMGTKKDIAETKTVRKILGVPIFETVARTNEPAASSKEHKKRMLDINLELEPDDEEEQTLVEENQSAFGSNRGVIDLNSCVIESDEQSLPLSKPPRVSRILEIDLEASPVQESDDDTAAEPFRENATDDYSLLQSQGNKIKSIHDDLGNAAEIIFAMSSFCPRVEENHYQPSETSLSSSEDSLLWFADIASSFADKDESTEKQLLSEEIDDFEVMALQLQEMREDKDFVARPFVQEPEEAGPRNSVTTRSRRGQSRRGRQRKDFQRDILPGLSTLSRQEVTEDLQTFGGLMRAMGHHWNLGSTRRSGPRNGGGARGRRRAATETLSNAVQNRAFEAPSLHKLANIECPVLEDRSITGWGKTTRRPRRQRCAASGNNNPMKAVFT